MDDNRKQALAAALQQIERQFGKGAIMRMGDGTAANDIGVVSTGSLALDTALGIGGLPRGRVVEIYGPESSGKTTLTLHAIAECQKLGGTAAFVDAEHALDPLYAEKLGVDVEDLLVSQPDTGEQALEITDMLVRSGAVDMVVVDSVAALTPKAEIEGDMGDSHVGLQARLMSQALRKLTGNIKRSNCMVVFINQIRMKIGVMFGSPETTTGGNALKFYSSVRLDIRRIGALKKGDEVVGNQTRVKVVKNKLAPPFKQAEFEILYGEGISREGELIELGVKHDFIDKSGAWYSYHGDRIGRSRSSSKALADPQADIPSSDQMRAHAYRLLGRREYSVFELAQRIRRKWPTLDPDDRTLGELLEALVAENLLSDERFAESFMRTRLQRFQGPLKIRSELRARGISDALTELALEMASGQWTDLAVEWLRRQHQGELTFEDRRKYYRRLVNRGFTHDQAMDAVNQGR
jgi:recombination protein RecA